jgi:hypothetical protein
MLLAIVLGAAALSGAQAPIAAGDPWTYIRAQSPLTITFRRGGVEFATLTFPAGTHVAISDGKRHAGGQDEYQGTVEVRVKPDAEVKNGPAHVIFSDVPLILKAEGVDVRVARTN